MRILEKKRSKLQHYARCVYYLSEIKTRRSNLKNAILVRTHRPQSNPPKRPESAVNDVEGMEYHRCGDLFHGI